MDQAGGWERLTVQTGRAGGTGGLQQTSAGGRPEAVTELVGVTGGSSCAAQHQCGRPVTASPPLPPHSRTMHASPLFTWADPATTGVTMTAGLAVLLGLGCYSAIAGQ